MSISAILWDYDGTLVDSSRKNMLVTIDVLRNLKPDIDENLPEVLIKYEKYQEANYKYKNWRELYRNCYGLTETQLDAAGKLWTPCQLANNTVPNMFNGLENTIQSLSHIKMGICSQNSSKNIRDTLEYYGVSECFDEIIGYDDISFEEQKPNASGFLKCVDRMKISDKIDTIIYVGDHSEDVVFGRNAESALKKAGFNVNVKCIAVEFLNHYEAINWKIKPDVIVHSSEELLKAINAIEQIQ